MKEIEFYVATIDIDKDGFVSEFDLELFLSRSRYFQVKQSATSSLVAPYYEKHQIQAQLFPTQPISEWKADSILRDLRQALFLHKISFSDFFKQLDLNGDGFITINEFCQSIDNVIKFP